MNYHDLLGVTPDAGPDEIRAAWQAKIADVAPSDWRFAAYNEALTELLKEHVEPTPEAVEEPGADEAAEPVASRPAPLAPQRTDDARATRVVPLWLLAALAVLAAACVAVAAIAWATPSPRSIEDRAREAQSSAESAAVAILSYDYRTLDQSERTAESTMTSSYRSKYAKIFAQIKANAPGTQTVVTTNVVDSAIVRAGQDRVQVLVLVDRPTTNKVQTTPLVYQDHVTVTMEQVGGDWLVDDMST